MSSFVAQERRAPYRLSLAVLEPYTLELITVAILIAVAFGLRLSQLHQSLAGDEVLAYDEIVGHSLGQMLHLVHTGAESSPPLFFVFAWLSAKLGDPSVLIRLPSLVLGTATVPVVSAIGRQAFGRVVGLIGAGVMALAPFAVWYGVEARPYAAMTFFVAFSTLALLRAVAARSRWWWALYVASSLAAAYTHYTCVFVLGIQALWSLWACRDRLRQPVLAAAAIALLYLPWLPYLHGKALALYSQLYPLTVGRVLSDLLRPIPGHPAAPLRAIPTIPWLAAFGLCAVAGLAAAVLKWGRPRRLSSQTALFVALAVATPIGVLLYSLLVRDLWLPRDLSASMPATALLLGALVAALPRTLMVVAVAIVTTTLLAGILRGFEPAYGRGPFRQLAAYLDRVAGPRDPVVVVSLSGLPAIRVQVHKPHLIVNAMAAVWSSTEPGRSAYVVLDDALARWARIGTPHPFGFRRIASRHYSAGPVSTTLFVYRRAR